MTTILYLYYNNPSAFEHLETTGLNTHKIKKLFVDDGSTPKLIINPTWTNTEVIRIEEDIPWNQPHANNLGFRHINVGKVIRLDIDHWFNTGDLDKLMLIDLPPKAVIKFNRIAHYKDKQPAKINSGKNIYMANTEDMLMIGGYNEAFCGNYGYEDGALFYEMEQRGFRIVTHPTVYVHTNVHHHTTGLNRDTAINKEKFERIRGTKTL
jgi:hypothetical protein